jgi:poly(3-hydroxybutyrate) depolymerase
MMRITVKNWSEELSGLIDSIDPMRPYLLPLSGAYEHFVPSGEGSRRLVVYLPEETTQSGSALLLLAPGGVAAEDFLATSGWKEVADEHKITVFVAESVGSSWNVVDEDDLDYLRAVREGMAERRYYNINAAWTYLVGCGDGASMAHKLATRLPAEFAALCTFGPVSVPESFLEEASHSLSNGKNERMGEVSLPVWLWREKEDEDAERIQAHWKRANCCEPRPVTTSSGDICYPPIQRGVTPLINWQPCAPVLLTEGKGRDVGGHEQADTVWREFLSRFARGKGVGNGNLRPRRTTDEWGLTRRDMLFGGFLRYWQEYIPESNPLQHAEGIPLVVALHGGSAIPENHVCNSEWGKVAKERGFAVVYPAAALRIMDNAIPHPAWNAAKDGRLMDDVGFLRAMLDDICARCPIDRTRVYITGHSMGSIMTHRLMMCCPDLFAAGGSTSGVVHGGFRSMFGLPDINTSLTAPIWVIMGEKDTGGGSFAENEEAVETFGFWLSHNGLETLDSASVYRSGGYRNYVWLNDKGVPLVRYSVVEDKPHSATAMDSWLLYDEFFSRYHRDAGGNVFYMGKSV